jgi:3-oxoacyl-[acyl-carrier-protein] synthase II
VITGLGVVTCLGHELELFWSNLLAGKSGVGLIRQFDASALPCQIAGEVTDLRVEDFISAKEARRMARASQLALIAAIQAAANAGLTAESLPSERTGVCFGTSIGGVERVDEGIQILRQHGWGKVNPFTIPSALPNMPAFHIAHEFHAVGTNRTVTTACATGTQAVGEGAEDIFQGRADVIFAGGAEAIIRDFPLAGFAAMKALPTSFNQDPTRASRPFDAAREGFVFSEGAACLILERLEHAVARGAHIYAEVIGHSSSSDAFHIAAPDPTGAGAVRTMVWALRDAAVRPEDIDYINAHGTSTPVNDSMETAAIKQVFGEHARRLAISSTKSMIGHAMGASGAIEASVCALSLERQILHPTINYETPDPACDLDYVPNQARPAEVEVALSNSFGLGGQNACLVLRRYAK